jgi:hypothetical protein
MSKIHTPKTLTLLSTDFTGKDSGQLTTNVTVDQFVIDMVYATLTDTSPLSKPTDKKRLFPRAPSASRRLINVLRKAHARGRFQVSVKERFGKHGSASIEQSFDVRVDAAINAEAKKEYAVFKIWLYAVDTDRLITVITVKFGRDHAQRANRHFIGFQFNPTSLLTAQNVWAAERLVSGELEHLLIMMTYPAMLLSRICEAVDPEFRTPALLHPRNFSQADIQNIQFATPLPIAAELQSGARELLAAHFDARRILTKGDKVEGYNIGKLLRVKCDTVDGLDRKGSPEMATVLLRKTSGSHDVCSVSIYDKPAQANLSAKAVAKLGIADLQRIDTTLQARGIDKLLTAARHLADDLKGAHKFELRSAKTRSMFDVLQAIAFINRHYVETFDGQSYQGFVDWLRLNVLFKEFHLSEILCATPAKLDQLEKHFKALGNRDRRYRKAWRLWCEGESIDVELRQCMKAAGLSPATVDRQMRRVHDLGLSGKIPPTYWADLKAVSLMWGATRADQKEFNRRFDADEPLRDQVAKHHSHLEPTLAALRKGLRTPAATVPVRNAPIMRSSKAASRLIERSAVRALPATNASLVDFIHLMSEAKPRNAQHVLV